MTPEDRANLQAALRHYFSQPDNRPDPAPSPGPDGGTGTPAGAQGQGQDQGPLQSEDPLVQEGIQLLTEGASQEEITKLIADLVSGLSAQTGPVAQVVEQFPDLLPLIQYRGRRPGDRGAGRKAPISR